MRKQFETALAGNSVAQRDLMRQAERAVMPHDQFIETQCEAWTLITDRYNKSMYQAFGSKAPIPSVLP